MFDFEIAASLAIQTHRLLTECGGVWPIHPIAWTLLTDVVRGAASVDALAYLNLPDSSLTAVGECLRARLGGT